MVQRLKFFVEQWQWFVVRQRMAGAADSKILNQPVTFVSNQNRPIRIWIESQSLTGLTVQYNTTHCQHSVLLQVSCKPNTAIGYRNWYDKCAYWHGTVLTAVFWSCRLHNVTRRTNSSWLIQYVIIGIWDKALLQQLTISNQFARVTETTDNIQPQVSEQEHEDPAQVIAVRVGHQHYMKTIVYDNCMEHSN